MQSHSAGSAVPEESQLTIVLTKLRSPDGPVLPLYLSDLRTLLDYLITEDGKMFSYLRPSMWGRLRTNKLSDSVSALRTFFQTVARASSTNVHLHHQHLRKIQQLINERDKRKGAHAISMSSIDDIFEALQGYIHRYLSNVREELTLTEESIIGRGSFGEVSRGLLAARDGHGNHTVAVKTPTSMNSVVIDAIFTELEMLMRAKTLGVPNVVQLIAYSYYQGVPRLAMNYAPGGTLRAQIDNETIPFSYDTFLQMIDQVLEALIHLHRHGIVHRDLKSENIFVDANGHLVVY